MLVYFTRYRLLYNRRTIAMVVNGRYWSRSVTGDGTEKSRDYDDWYDYTCEKNKKKFFVVFQRPTANLLSLLRRKRDGKFFDLWQAKDETPCCCSFEFLLRVLKTTMAAAVWSR